jgi:hypothetical protein
MKNINPLGLFDDHFLLEALSKLDDPLQKLNKGHFGIEGLKSEN